MKRNKTEEGDSEKVLLSERLMRAGFSDVGHGADTCLLGRSEPCSLFIRVMGTKLSEACWCRFRTFACSGEKQPKLPGERVGDID